MAMAVVGRAGLNTASVVGGGAKRRRLAVAPAAGQRPSYTAGLTDVRRDRRTLWVQSAPLARHTRAGTVRRAKGRASRVSKLVAATSNRLIQPKPACKP